MSDTEEKQPLHGPDFVLDVEHFGPIAEARDIAFKPMTVFVGPSNTGKSYLALLMHSLLKGFDDDARSRGLPRAVWDTKPYSTELDGLLRETAVLTRRSIEKKEINGPDRIRIDSFSPPTRAFLQDNIDHQLASWSDGITASICDHFEVDDVTQLTKFLHQLDSARSWSLHSSSPAGNWRFTFDADRPRLDLALNELSWVPERLAGVVVRIEGDNAGGGDDRDLGLLLFVYLRELGRGIADIDRSWYLPASRTGILVSHKVLTDSILADAHRFGLDAGTPGRTRYHKVAADFLRAINATDPEARLARRSASGNDFGPHSRVAESIEQSVIGGTIEVETNEYGPPDFSFAPDGYTGLKVPMARSSSMVTELAPIVAFLRSHIEAGDLLIIEEPEAHLHPSAQQKLAGVLAYMVRKGLRVLITTHSHYMVEAMGMFVNNSEVEPEKREDAMRLLGEVDRELYLTRDEVAVYGFDSLREAGTVVHPVPFDEKSYSFAPVGYSKALVEQFNRISRVMGARMSGE